MMSVGKCSFAAVRGLVDLNFGEHSVVLQRNPEAISQGECQPIEMQFALFKIPPLAFSPP